MQPLGTQQERECDVASRLGFPRVASLSASGCLLAGHDHRAVGGVGGYPGEITVCRGQSVLYDKHRAGGVSESQSARAVGEHFDVDIEASVGEGYVWL